MLRAFVTKTIADIRSEWMIGGVVVAILVVAATTTVLAVVVGRGGALLWDDVVALSNGPDAWFIGQSPAGAVERLGELDTVADVEGPIRLAGPYRVPGTVAIEDLGSGPVSLFLVAAQDPPRSGLPRIVDGSWPANRDEILVDHAIAQALEIAVGGNLTLIGEAGDADFSVVGTGVTSISCARPECDPHFAFTTPDGLARMEASPADLVLLSLADPDMVPAVLAEAEQLLPVGAIGEVFVGSSMRDTFLEEATISGIGFFGSAAVTLLIVGLSVLHLGALRVEYQRHDAAILRAVGITPGQLMLMFLGQLLLVATVVFVVGAGLAFMLGGWILRDLTASVDAGFLPPIDAGGLAVAFFVVLFVIGLAGLGPAWRTAHLRAPESQKEGRSGRVRIRALRVGPILGTGLRQTWHDKPRAILSVTTLALGFATVILAIGAVRTTDELTFRPELLGDPVDITINDSSFTLNAATRLLASDPRVTTIFTAANYQARRAGGSDIVTARLLGGDYPRAGYTISAGRMIAGPGEAVAGYGLLAHFDLDIGDSIAINVGEETVELDVVGRHGESDNRGMVVMFDEATLTTPLPTSVLLRLTDRDHIDGVRRDIEEAAPGIALTVESPGPGSVARSLRTTSAWLATTLVVLALIHLAAITILTTRKHQKDIGILKSLGFTPRAILMTVLAGNMTLTLIAGLAGIGFGLVTLRLLLSRVGIELGTGPDFGSYPSLWTILVLVPVAMVVVFVFTILAGSRAAAISPARVLRYE